MKQVKRNILEHSIHLFNEKGFAQVSLQNIADRVGISKGNLAYHFANTGIILEAIQGEMMKEMENVIRPAGFIPFSFLESALKYFYAFQLKYRFFFLDLVEISRRYPRIAEKQMMIIAKRKEEGRALLNYFIGSGWLIPEPEAGRYDDLIHTVWMLNTFWMSQQRLFDGTTDNFDKSTPIHKVWNLLKPYLTEEGLKQLSTI